MVLFLFGLVLGIIGLVFVIMPPLSPPNRRKAPVIPAIARKAVGVLIILLAIAAVVWSTAIYVRDDQGGLVIKKLFGPDLPANRIIATNGEKGPQADILPPGWHFFYWPWMYQTTPVEIQEIPQGMMGVITAQDGQPLPKDSMFADAWDDHEEMLNARNFLSSGKGYKGPQLTVLPPGKYRYNPELFKIELKPILRVPIGKVAVIKTNAGPTWTPPEGEEVETVNGSAMVPKDYRGIWKTALEPNTYRLHPEAYEATLISTENRIYHYIDKGAIVVRTKDGFEFPVDVRVSVLVSADHAPYLIAQISSPDRDSDKNGFTDIEDKAILPAIRAIFRNNAEDKGALEYVESRSAIEKSAGKAFAEGLAAYRIDSKGVYIADIGLSRTEEGRRLLKTQTDKQIAEREVQTYEKQRAAQIERSELVKAEENANQEREKAKARARVEIAREDANAAIEAARGEAEAIAQRASGEAKAWREKVEALGGVENFVRLEVAKQGIERWGGDIPTVLVIGEGSSQLDALMGTMLKEKNK